MPSKRVAAQPHAARKSCDDTVFCQWEPRPYRSGHYLVSGVAEQKGLECRMFATRDLTELRASAPPIERESMAPTADIGWHPSIEDLTLM